MPTKPYNPDASINAEQRAKNAKAIGARYADQHADDVRGFSPWELEELRADLRSLSNTLRRDRLLNLLDAAEAAHDYQAVVSAALDAAAMNELPDVVGPVEEDIHEEISRENAVAEIDELLSDHPEATPTQLLGMFKVWHAEEVKRLKLEVTRALNPISRAIAASVAAIDQLA